MVKRVLLCGISLIFVAFAFAFQSFATDAGPAELKLISSDGTKKPPVIFPHKKHQDAFKCGECHHGNKDGKQVAYTDGMEIKKCETCHNDTMFPGNKEHNSFKAAGHGNCLTCHKEVAKKDESKKHLKSCNTCHAK